MKNKIKSLFVLIFCFLLVGSLTVNIDGVTYAKNGVNHTLRASSVTVIDESSNLETKIDDDTDEDYLPTSRKWTGPSTIIRSGNNIFVAWQTGGVREPDVHNYITVAVSSDNGKTWIDPFIIVDYDGIMLTCPMFYFNNLGQLYMLFFKNQQGVFALPLYNSDGDINEISYDEPFFTGVNNSSFTKPTMLSDGRIAYVSGMANKSGSTCFIVSDNDGLSYNYTTEIQSVAPENARKYAESSLVELSDGRLWALRRLENAVNGGVEQSFSTDGGLTWSVFNSELPSQIRSPGSRFTMGKLKSGALLFITNAEGAGPINRYKMTAYLSTDDGRTWPYSLRLDNHLSSYPDFYQDNDGTIYACFDKDRYGEASMRVCVFTEDDVKQGEWNSEKAHQLITVMKVNKEYSDIVSVNGAYAKKEKVKPGTDIKDVLSRFPKQVTVTDEYGKQYTLNGSYKISGYDANTKGVYKATFVTSLPMKLIDSFGLLEFSVIVDDSTDSVSGSGCVANVSNSYYSLILIPIGLVLITIKAKKTKR